jgi:hypothetical protein
MNERQDHISWLLSCPCNDCNFKSHLKQAYAKDIAYTIEVLPEKGNKSKITALKRELKHRVYEVNTFKENSEIATSNTFTDYYEALVFYNNLLDDYKEFIEKFFVDKNSEYDDSEYDIDNIKYYFKNMER